MPAYAKKTTIEDQFGARRTPGGAILCNRCNCNIADSEKQIRMVSFTCSLR